MASKRPLILNDTGPWPDVVTARLFLTRIVYDHIHSDDPSLQSAIKLLDVNLLANWLIKQGLGPLAYNRCQSDLPDLAAALKIDSYEAAAENSLHFDCLARLGKAFAANDLQAVLLKGAALATVYGDPALRPMSDVDVWVRPSDMAQTCQIMQGLGFTAYGKVARPPRLQALSAGEIQFYGKNWGLVELHWSPFPGWWLSRTAVINDDALWSRKEQIKAGEPFYQLAAEDMVIHVAIHLAVNHQFSASALRSLVDIAMMTQARPVDWVVVADRAKAWRVSTAVWLVLHLLDELIGTPGLKIALARLRPSRWRQQLLNRFVSPNSVLAGADMREHPWRFAYLLILVDRGRDAARLLFRSLWPETEWLQARYQKKLSHWRHLWQLVRHGRI